MHNTTKKSLVELSSGKIGQNILQSAGVVKLSTGVGKLSEGVCRLGHTCSWKVLAWLNILAAIGRIGGFIVDWRMIKVYSMGERAGLVKTSGEQGGIGRNLRSRRQDWSNFQ